MYKTIRHGENSLQYTILPQNDDFRLEGKIKSSSGGGSKKNKVKKPKRRSFFAYLGLLFVCTVIIGAVLVPFLVSAECLPNPTEWFLKTKAAFTKGTTEIKPSITNHPNTQGTVVLNKGNLAMNGINVGKSVKIINKDGVEKIILKVNKTATSTEENKTLNIPIQNDQGNAATTSAEFLSINKEIDSKTDQANAEKITITHLNMADHQLTDTTLPPLIPQNEETTFKSLPPSSLLETIIQSSTTTTTTTSPLLNRLLTSASVPNVPRASLQSSLNQSANNSSTQPTITTRIMQVPLLKSTAKKPAIPPVLVKNLSPIQPTPDTSNLNDIIPANMAANKDMKKDTTANSDWIHSHWPYIDPSTYFQWNVSKILKYKLCTD